MCAGLVDGLHVWSRNNRRKLHMNLVYRMLTRSIFGARLSREMLLGRAAVNCRLVAGCLCGNVHFS